jgi:hypothetical protein
VTTLARVSAAALGLLLGAQGIGKLLDMSGYGAALARFRAFPAAAVGVVGLIWVGVELLSGGALLLAALASVRVAWKVGAAAAVVDTLAYAFLTVSARLRHLHLLNCTCFGIFLPQPLSTTVLGEDAFMLLWAVWALRSSLR